MIVFFAVMNQELLDWSYFERFTLIQFVQIESVVLPLASSLFQLFLH